MASVINVNYSEHCECCENLTAFEKLYLLFLQEIMYLVCMQILINMPLCQQVTQFMSCPIASSKSNAVAACLKILNELHVVIGVKVFGLSH